MKTAVTLGLVAMTALVGAQAATTFDPDLPSKAFQAAKSGVMELMSPEEPLQIAAASATPVEEQAEPEIPEVDQVVAHAPEEPAKILPEILVDIDMEREALRRERGALDTRKAELWLAEDALEEQRKRLEELRGTVDGLLERARANHIDDVEKLVNIYGAMKAAQAAAIMDEIDIEVAVLVLAAMKESTAGPIMAVMNPVRSRAISKIILQRSRLPGDQTLVGVRLQ